MASSASTYVRIRIHLSPIILLRFLFSFTLLMFFLWYYRPAFSVVPIIGYALLAALVSYLIIRLGKHLKSKFNANQARLPTSLPKSTKTASVSSKDLDAGISTGWNWRKWRSSLSFPRVPYWSKVPVAAEAVVGKAKAVATAKNLSVELLPTTGLPPPPSSIPSSGTSTHLVDLSTPTPTKPTTPFVPVTPALTTGSTSNSFPSSPRTPSPSPFGHFNIPKAIFYPAPPHPSYPRPPSPHALLATTPPQKQPHRRSRSLGGVPVRRLSGNSSSGLRNAIEMDVEMEEVKNTYSSHLRGTSREHLLIDFSSSSSSDEDDTKVSPAASDIGVLSSNSGQANAPMVGRHVPLVDLSDAEDNHPPSEQGKTTDNASWKWFGNGPPSLSYASMHPFTDAHSNEKQVFSRVEKLIDVDTTDSKPEQVLRLQSDVNIGVHRVELGDVRHREELLVDVSDDKPRYDSATMLYPQTNTKGSEAPLVDLRDDVVGQLVDIEEQPSVSKPQLQIPSLPLHAKVLTTPVLVRSSFSQPHPLENLAHVTTQLMSPQSTSTITSVQATSIVKEEKVYAQVADEPSLLFPGLQSQTIAESQPAQLVDISPDDESVFEYPVTEGKLSEVASPLSPLVVSAEEDKPIEVDSIPVTTTATTQDSWSESWEEVNIEDPWGSHVPEPEEVLEPEVATPDSEVFVYTGVDAIVPVIEPQYPQETSVEQFTIVKVEEPEVVLEDLEVVLDKSPGGNLFATVLPDSDDDDIEGVVPTLSLDSEQVETGPDSEKAETNALLLQDEEGDDDDEEITPKPTPASVKLELPETATDISSSGDVPVIVIDEEEGTTSSESHYPDPELLPLPESPLMVSTQNILVIATGKKDEPERLSPSQTPTPPASPPISPLRFVAPSSVIRLPSPRLAIASPLPRLQDLEDKENRTPIAVNPVADSRSLLSTTVADNEELPSSGLRRRVFAPIDANEEEKIEIKEDVSSITALKVAEDENEPSIIVAPELKLSTSLPGSFPEPSVVSAVSSATPSTTIAARLARTPDAMVPRPSARAIVRSPVDIALAMQLRPGLGAGADPAWMVRFLMAMFGWLAVVVSQGGEY